MGGGFFDIVALDFEEAASAVEPRSSLQRAESCTQI